MLNRRRPMSQDLRIELAPSSLLQHAFGREKLFF
jgi:hypothetical protein